MTELNPQQLLAIKTTHGPLRIIAGPGTGKTRTLVERAAFLIEHLAISPSRILLLTFTNKASHELSQRLSQKGYFGIHALTFHSLAARFLRKYWGKGFVIASPENSGRSNPERIKIIRDCFVVPQSGTPRNDDHNEAILLTFDELLTTLLDLFQERPEVLQACQSSFDFVMVDEYQDVNTEQIEITKMLVAKHRNIAVVGDPDQSIYGFRGSRGDSFDHFLELYPDSKTIVLNENYRNPKYVLEASERLISKNPHRLSKNLLSLSSLESLVKLWKSENADHFFTMLFSLLESILGTQSSMHTAGEADREGSSRPLSDVAILYRTQAEGKVIASALERRGYPYSMSSPECFWGKKEVKEFLEGLASAWSSTKPHNDNRFSSFLRKHLQGFTEIKRLPLHQQNILFQLLPYAFDFDHLPFFEALQNFLDFAKLSQESDNLVRQEGINLLTLHAAKGLEFPLVIIVGLEDGRIPPKYSPDLSEERRLLYVGMTRSQEELHLFSTGPSQFLSDMLLPCLFQEQTLHAKNLRSFKRWQAKKAQLKMF